MNPGRGQSLTLRLTLLFASASALVLLLLGLLIGVLVERHFEELDMELLGGELAHLRHAVAQVRGDADWQRLPNQLNDALVGRHGLSVLVRAPDGRTAFASGQARFPEALLRARTQSAASSSWSDAQGRRLRGLAALVASGQAGAPPALVAVATDLHHHEDFMRSFGLALWSVVGLASVLTGLLGWGAVRHGLAPLDDIKRRAADITATRLDQRLSLASVPQELRAVAETLNDMLARLEESFHRLSDFSADLAHELRTPLSNLLTQTQVTLSRARSAEQYREVLASNAEELERLARMVADMLFLAKADNRQLVPRREHVDLAAEVRGLFEFYEVLAEEKGVRLISRGQASVRGDHLMLRRALGNLLANAIEHTPAGGQVEVDVGGAAPGRARVAVSNTGETIAPEHLPRLFDRFYRVEPARRHAGEGAGLGLAITQSIIQAHGGAIGVRSADGRTTFELLLPV